MSDSPVTRPVRKAVSTGTAYRPLGRRDNSEFQPGAARSFDVAGANAEIQTRW
jgi:hypothetical protein